MLISGYNRTYTNENGENFREISVTVSSAEGRKVLNDTLIYNAPDQLKNYDTISIDQSEGLYLNSKQGKRRVIYKRKPL